MNKITKGAIATAAGIALLLGGAGTFALWNGNVAVAGGTLSTGTLTIASVGSPTWADASSGTVTAVPAGATSVVAVPGDVYTMTQQVTIGETGKNIKANLVVSGAAFESTGVFNAAANSTTVTTVNAVAQPSGSTLTNATATLGAANNWVVTPGTAPTTTFNVVTTITFNSTVSGTTAQGLTGAVDLSKLAYTLTQVRP
jgi:alternate signal-mediated exported protein